VGCVDATRNVGTRRLAVGVVPQKNHSVHVEPLLPSRGFLGSHRLSTNQELTHVAGKERRQIALDHYRRAPLPTSSARALSMSFGQPKSLRQFQIAMQTLVTEGCGVFGYPGGPISDLLPRLTRGQCMVVMHLWLIWSCTSGISRGGSFFFPV
jgi:hypothetical protein